MEPVFSLHKLKIVDGPEVSKMVIKKSKDGTVRFVFPGAIANSVFLVGDFNKWDEHSLPMQKTSSNRFELELKIPPGDYQFKYLADGIWWNDPEADDFRPNYWGSEDSVLKV